jgi:large subunit ribosomal protein L25
VVTGISTHGAHLFDVWPGRQERKVLVKEVQYDHLGMEVIHVDFARVSLDEKVEITVPLELKGTPKGEADGGVLQQIVSELEIECLVTDIPDMPSGTTSATWPERSCCTSRIWCCRRA